MPLRLLRALVSAATLASALSTSRIASADVQAKDIEWEAPAGCPSHTAVYETVRGIMRSGTTAPPHVKVTVTGPPWEARIEVGRTGELGARRLEASTCE